MSEHPYDAMVAGAGPAGLIAAWRLAAAGKRVAVLESHSAIGRKLLLTGAGKCNLTNVLDADAMARRFGAAQRFVQPALRAFPPEALRKWFADRGVPTLAADGFHYFPASQRASDVLAALHAACREAGVEFFCGLQARSVEFSGHAVSRLCTLQYRHFPTGRVIVATGGISYSPVQAEFRSGYELARRAGHTVVEPTPALAGLRTRETWPGECKGIVLSHTRTRLDRKTGAEGEIVFSHRGLSGPAVIDLAGEATARLAAGQRVTLTLQLMAGRDAAQWRELLAGWRREHGRRNLVNCLAAELPAALARQLAAFSGIAPERKTAELSRAESDRLIAALTELPLEISGSEGWDKAMATRGGVSRGEINPRTLESRLVKGLYFAGEVIDVDGPCGGYNLQWAFSSGWQAGAP